MNTEDYDEKMSVMQNWANALRLDLINDLGIESPNTIYHYTDIGGLIGILNSGSIWATHVSKLNDSSEYIHGVKLVREFTAKSKNRDSKKLIEKALEQFTTKDTYIACYSTERDLLSQWRAYSTPSIGYSLGLATDGMATLDGKMPLLEPVIYDDDVAEKVILSLLDAIDRFLNENDFGEVEVGYLLGTLEANLNLTACMIKNHKFREESEFRHIYQPGVSPLKLNLNFRVGRFGLTPYVCVKFLKENYLPIKNITIGPCLDFDVEKHSLSLLLKNTGYENVEILNSEIPLRV